jgi:hypothetical protein
LDATNYLRGCSIENGDDKMKNPSYRFSAYRRGSTNGQRPFAQCIVVNAASKDDAQAIALKALKAYKVLGIKVGSRENELTVAEWAEDLHKMPCPIFYAEQF